MKVKINNKEYQYDYKSVFLKPELHKELKMMSVMEDRSMSDTVKVILDYYKKFA